MVHSSNLSQGLDVNSNWWGIMMVCSDSGSGSRPWSHQRISASGALTYRYYWRSAGERQRTIKIQSEGRSEEELGAQTIIWEAPSIISEVFCQLGFLRFHLNNNWIFHAFPFRTFDFFLPKCTKVFDTINSTWQTIKKLKTLFTKLTDTLKRKFRQTWTDSEN